MTDQGRSALAERLEAEWHAYPPTVQAERILGEHGLFIADASQHEPFVDSDEMVSCTCGHVVNDLHSPGHATESYFDHIVGAP